MFNSRKFFFYFYVYFIVAASEHTDRGVLNQKVAGSIPVRDRFFHKNGWLQKD